MTPTELTLTGPNGANPLGFLCALGTLRTLSNAWPDGEVKMAWKQEVAAWQPVLRANTDLNDREALVKAIYDELKMMDGHPAFTFKDKDGNEWSTTEVSRAEYARYAKEATQEDAESDVRWMGFVAAFACESTPKSDSEDTVQDTEFRLLGGGRQQFLVALRHLVTSTQQEHLSEAVFGPWLYRDSGDGNLSLRWDPADDRRHALRWTDPTKATSKLVNGKNRSSKIWTVIGANRLAMEALPLFPVFPVGRRLATTGFKGGRKHNTFLSWPLWDGFINVDTARSILSLSELQRDEPAPEVFRPQGVVEIYRIQKIGVGNYKNFTPAQPV